MAAINQGLITVRVARKGVEAIGICTFELEDPGGRPLPPFAAGSHVDVHVPGGPVRQYSLCNDPQERHRYLIGVLRDAHSRGGSIAMHERVGEGDLLSISEPKNHFQLAHGAARSLLVAGGIGVTPILCMAERLAHAGSPFEMHYCTRSRERTAFYDRIRRSTFVDEVLFHFDDGPPAQRFDIDGALAHPEPATHLYVCGPAGFMDAVLGAASRLGWRDENVHREYFAPAAQPARVAGEFDVKIASSGRVVRIAADTTVVQALAAAGVEILTSCEQGVCGTCLTRVLDGEPDHRDSYLTDEERARNDQFTPCCSRAKSAVLVLDL
jgi:vanillate O-demethylase ferredoxin subunit